MSARGETGAELSIEAKNLKWFNRCEELTPGVEREFAAATKDFEVPSRGECRSLASLLMGKRARKDAGPTRQANAAADLRARKGAHKSATALQLHLKPLRRKLEILISDIWEPAALQETLAHYNKELELLDAAEKAAVALLPALARPPIATLADYEPIRVIADKAQEAWASANDGKAPTGKGEENPLVKLVVGLFGLVEIGYTPSTVSAVLRDRRRIKR
jgi:hypothetical protein